MVLLIKDEGDIVGELDIDSDDLDAFSPGRTSTPSGPWPTWPGPACRGLIATLG